MHQAQSDFVRSVVDGRPILTRKNLWILDVGSLDVNGNNRQFFHPESTYLGIDIVSGKNVDAVCTAGHLIVSGKLADFDVVISTEMLEHSPGWRDDLHDMWRLVKPGGTMILTCAGTGRPEHGTRRCPTHGMACDQDYYQNLTPQDLLSVLGDRAWRELHVSENRSAQDTYLWGVRDR